MKSIQCMMTYPSKEDAYLFGTHTVSIRKETLLDLVIQDIHNHRIQVSIKKELIYKFEPLFVEGQCYQISNFGVADNSGRLPLLAHKFKIALHKNTTVTRIGPIDDNIKGFVFEGFRTLWDIQNPVSEFDAKDVIGTVVAIGDIVPLNWSGVKKLRRTVVLQDADENFIDCTFWDAWAERWNEYSENRDKKGHTVCILQLGKVKYWNGKPAVHNALFGSKMYINSDLPEMNVFRQILPVIPSGSRQDVVNASINSSHLWKHCTVLRLTVNMRLGTGSNSVDKQEIKEFADWILHIGDGKLGGRNDGEAVVEFPEDVLIPDSNDHVASMVQETYPDLLPNLWYPKFFQERAILAPTHELVDVVNKHMLNMIPGEVKTYYSSDTVSACDSDTTFDESVYTTDFLNSIKMSGLPHHELSLKIGAPIMCMRNVDQKAGLCNGTRLQALRMGINIIEAKIIS